MPSKARTVPRKIPTQQRSRDTVDAIIAAATRVLVKEGFEGTTTNKVAATAGVSIGSLYQYFPSKEALVAALVERHAEAMRDLTLGELARVQTLPVERAVPALIELVIQVHAVDLKLHRVILEQVPRLGRMDKLWSFHQMFYRAVAAALEARTEELAIRDPELTAYILVTAVDSLVIRTVLNEPERLDDPRLKRELSTLVLGYLEKARGD